MFDYDADYGIEAQYNANANFNTVSHLDIGSNWTDHMNPYDSNGWDHTATAWSNLQATFAGKVAALGVAFAAKSPVGIGITVANLIGDFGWAIARDINEFISSGINKNWGQITRTDDGGFTIGNADQGLEFSKEGQLEGKYYNR